MYHVHYRQWRIWNSSVFRGFCYYRCVVAFLLIVNNELISGTHYTASPLAHSLETGQFVSIDKKHSGIIFHPHRRKENPLHSSEQDLSIPGGAVALGDYDNDGLSDLLLTNRNGFFLYQNLGSFRFKPVKLQTGEYGEHWGTGATFVDINNDGHLDIYICCYNLSPNLLYINQGDGTFVELASAYGLDYIGASASMIFNDIDLDGDLDAYLLTNNFVVIDLLGQQWIELVDSTVVVPKIFRGKGVIVKPDGTPMWIETGEKDFLFLNKDNTHFEDISEAAGISALGIGLAANWWDYNDDRYPDLYVSNDFYGQDYLYRNNKDGTFTDVTREALPHIPWFSMGSDVGDINNDGLFDFIATDMSGTDHFKQKVGMGDMEKNGWFLSASDPPQYMRNAVYLNTGSHHFMEAAFLCGLSNTDWTWTVKFADLDNDGLNDLFVTNGMTRDWFNSDLRNRAKLFDSQAAADAFWDKQEIKNDTNLVFRNSGDLKFDNMNEPWGLDLKAASFGSAMADLDNDGDLDIVVVNHERPPSLYRNDLNNHNRVRIKLRGHRSNRNGIGAKITLNTEEGKQVRYVSHAGGFISGKEATVYFGLGQTKQISSLEIQWPSGLVNTYKQLAVNQSYLFEEFEDVDVDLPREKPQPMFAKMTMLKEAEHVENPYNDFADQPLLPQRYSQLGPALALGDIDRDGDDDLYIGSAANQCGMLYINNGKGDFSWGPLSPFYEDRGAEDMGALFFDADSDGDLDLYVASGSSEFKENDPALLDRLYINDGGGNFTKSKQRLPDNLQASGSCVVGGDYDRDGDIDLFVGARIIPGRYPLSPESSLLENREGTFINVVKEKAEKLRHVGLVTSAIWSDVNGDNWMDLLVTTEWGPVNVYVNHEGILKEQTAAAKLGDQSGWFNAIAAGDIDHDGDSDYVVTNLGLNTKYLATPENPHIMFYGDLDGSGKPHIVEAGFEHDVLYPVRGKSCSTNAMPSLQKKFTTFHDFALAPLNEIYSPSCINEAKRFEANTFTSVVLLNDGTGRFTRKALPTIAQIAPGFGVALTDVNGDGHLDIYFVQNFYSNQPETGQMDGGVSLLLTGDGLGNFTEVWPNRSGLLVPSDAKGLVVSDINNDRLPDFIVSVNDGSPVVMLNQQQHNTQNVTIKLVGKKGNTHAVGAKVNVTFTNDTSDLFEITGGGSYLSQSSNDLFVALAARQIKNISVIWPSQQKRTIMPKEKGQNQYIIYEDPSLPKDKKHPPGPRLSYARAEDYSKAHLDLARQLLSRKKINRAIDQLHYAINHDTSQIELYKTLGNAYFENKDYNKAILSYQQVLAMEAAHNDSLVNSARSYRFLDEPQQALTYYQRALEINPDNDTLHYEIARIYEKVGRLDKMKQHDDLALTSRPKHFSFLHYNLARYQEDQRMDSKAKSHYATATDYRHEPRSFFAAIDMAKLAHAKADHEFSLFCTNKALALGGFEPLHPYYAYAHNSLGLAFSKSGKLEQAIDHYEKALNINTDFIEAHYILGTVLEKMGKDEQATKHFQRALTLEPALAQGQYNLGIVLEKTGKREQAIEHLQQALNLNPDNTDAHYSLGAVLGKMGKREQAIEHLQQALKQEPDHADVHYNLGVLLEKMGKREQAIEHFQQTVKLKPDDLEAHYKLGNEFVELGKFEQAIAHYQQTVKLKPDYTEANYNLGVLLGKTGKLDKAIEHFQQTVKLKPDHTEAHYKLGVALAALGQPGQAIERFQQTLTLKPDYADAHYRLAGLLFKRNKNHDAIVHLQEALRLKPDEILFHNTLAWILATAEDENLRDPTEAVRLAKRASELTQYARPEILDTFAAACAAAGDFPQAIEIAEKALRLAVDDASLTLEIQDHLKRYKANKPVYER